MKQMVKQYIQNTLLNANLALVRVQQIEKDDALLYARYSSESIENKRFYNVGAGSFSHRHWTNIDYATEHYAQYQTQPFINHNLMALQDFPIESETAQAVYSSHTIEHISDAAVDKFLTESYRILTREGVIRLTAPDAELDWRAYQARDADFWYWRHEPLFNSDRASHAPMKQASIEQLLMLHLFSQLSPLSKDKTATQQFDDGQVAEILKQNDMVAAFEYFASLCHFNVDYPGNHINWWTKDKAIAFLRRAGFTDIRISAYGQSACPPMRNTRFFDNTMPKISFYVEAVKT